jgi:hypothetical protein
MRRFFRGGRRGFAPDVPPMLQRANEFMGIGDYASAAIAFEQLARAAEGRGGPRAPIFHMQVGRARILAGQLDAGVAAFKHGFDLLAQRGEYQRLFKTGTRVTQELNERGLTKEASEVEASFKALLPAQAEGPFAPPATPEKKPVLPTHCPACGAPLRPDEVEWMDNATAECAFCGSPVRGE